MVTVAGAVDPPRGALTVHLTYTPVSGPPPTPAAVSHDVLANAAGTFSDMFDRQNWSWSVVAAVDADELYSDAVSAPCAIPIP